MTIKRGAFVLQVNPEPWKTPPFSAVRKGGRAIVVAGRDETSHITKEAIAAELLAQGAEMMDPPYMIHFLFYRHREHYVSEKGRNLHKREADGTNMQKLTEDAMQGVLITNDVKVRFISSQVVEQSKTAPALIVILIETGHPEGYFETPMIPARFDQGGELTARIEHARATALGPTASVATPDNSWGDSAPADF